MRDANTAGGQRTKERLLRAAEVRMLQRGFIATSVDEICREAEVSKGSFFHFFASKDELAEAVLDHFVELKLLAIPEGDQLGEGPLALRKVFKYLDWVAATFRETDSPAGCLLGTFAQEAEQGFPQLRPSCAQHFDRWISALHRLLERARKECAPQARVDTAFLAELFATLFQGSVVLAKGTGDRGVMDRNLKYFKKILQTAFQQE